MEMLLLLSPKIWKCYRFTGTIPEQRTTRRRYR